MEEYAKVLQAQISERSVLVAKALTQQVASVEVSKKIPRMRSETEDIVDAEASVTCVSDDVCSGGVVKIERGNEGGRRLHNVWHTAGDTRHLAADRGHLDERQGTEKRPSEHQCQMTRTG